MFEAKDCIFPFLKKARSVYSRYSWTTFTAIPRYIHIRKQSHDVVPSLLLANRHPFWSLALWHLYGMQYFNGTHLQQSQIRTWLESVRGIKEEANVERSLGWPVGSLVQESNLARKGEPWEIRIGRVELEYWQMISSKLEESLGLTGTGNIAKE